MQAVTFLDAEFFGAVFFSGGALTVALGRFPCVFFDDADCTATVFFFLPDFLPAFLLRAAL